MDERRWCAAAAREREPRGGSELGIGREKSSSILWARARGDERAAGHGFKLSSTPSMKSGINGKVETDEMKLPIKQRREERSQLLH